MTLAVTREPLNGETGLAFCASLSVPVEGTTGTIENGIDKACGVFGE